MALIQFASEEKKYTELYHLMVGCVTPRPIGWVSTISAQGRANLAPFSFFNGVSPNPPSFAFSSLDRRDGSMKDTVSNLREVPECVIHIVSEELGAQMNETSADFDHRVDEFEESGLKALPSHSVSPPRIENALAAFECRVSHHLRLGSRPPHASHVVVEALYWHLNSKVVNDDNTINPDALRSLGRMGNMDYTRTNKRFAMSRPVISANDPRAIQK